MDVTALWHAGLDGVASIATPLIIVGIGWLLRRVSQGNDTAAQAQLIALAQNVGAAAYRQLSAYGDAHLKNVTSHNAMVDYCIQEARDVVLPALTAAGVTPESFRTLVLGGLGHALAADPNVMLLPPPVVQTPFDRLVERQANLGPNNKAANKPLAFSVDGQTDGDDSGSLNRTLPVAGSVDKAAASVLVLICVVFGLAACSGSLSPVLTDLGVSPTTAATIDASAAKAGQLMCLADSVWLAAEGANVKNATSQAVSFTCNEIAKGSQPGAPPPGTTASLVPVAADVLALLNASKTN